MVFPPFFTRRQSCRRLLVHAGDVSAISLRAPPTEPATGRRAGPGDQPDGPPAGPGSAIAQGAGLAGARARPAPPDPPPPPPPPSPCVASNTPVGTPVAHFIRAEDGAAARPGEGDAAAAPRGRARRGGAASSVGRTRKVINQSSSS